MATRGFFRLGLIAVVAWYAWQLSLASVVYLAQGPEYFAEPFRQKFTEMLPWVVTHGLTASLALALGPLLFLGAYFETLQRSHRWLGPLYLVACLIAGLTGLPLSLRAEGGLIARLGFLVLNALWLTFTWKLWRDFGRHRAWVRAHYALTFSAVISRVGLSLSDYLNLDFTVTYPILAWASWLPGCLWGVFLVRRNKIDG